MLSRLVSFALLASLVSPAALASGDSGQVCIAAWHRENGSKMLDRPLKDNSAFTILVAGKSTIHLPASSQVPIKGLPIKFRVSVALDGKPMESFGVDLRSYSNRSACMWLDSLYVTWQVYPYVHGKHGCSCFGA